MCSPECVQFGQRVLRPEEIAGRSVLEVGSYNVNGTLRGLAMQYGPREYVGVDLVRCDHKSGPCTTAPCVDRICRVDDLVATFGAERFDVVISTEMLEHVTDWRAAVYNLKGVLKRGGLLVLTTRSPGFPRHDFPSDYWRFTHGDMRHIFADFQLGLVQDDPGLIGIFIAGRKPADFREKDLSGYEVYSMQRDTAFYYVSAGNERPPIVEKAAGRRFMGRVEEATAFCNRLNEAVGWPYYAVVQAQHISDTQYNVSVRPEWPFSAPPQ